MAICTPNLPTFSGRVSFLHAICALRVNGRGFFFAGAHLCERAFALCTQTRNVPTQSCVLPLTLAVFPRAETHVDGAASYLNVAPDQGKGSEVSAGNNGSNDRNFQLSANALYDAGDEVPRAAVAEMFNEFKAAHGAQPCNAHAACIPPLDDPPVPVVSATWLPNP